MPESEDAPFAVKLKAIVAAAQTASGVSEAVASALEGSIAALTSKTLSASELQKIALKLIQTSKQNHDVPAPKA